MKTIKEEIQKRILDNPRLAPAINLATYSIKYYSYEDWKYYEKKTGNSASFLGNDIKKMIINIKKMKMIDKATGFEDENQKNLDLLKFILYFMDNFEKDLNNNDCFAMGVNGDCNPKCPLYNKIEECNYDKFQD